MMQPCHKSCSPNASRHLNRSAFALELRANRDIKEGEEICISYGDITPQVRFASGIS
jgi:SET domain-containing protein